MTSPVRLPPLSLAELDADERRFLAGNFRRADQYLTDAADAPPLPGVLGLLARHARIGAPWLAFSGTLLDAGVLDPRDRELLILRVGWRTRSRYEWAQHVGMGLAAGLTQEEVDAIPAGPEAGGWNDRDLALLQATDELIDRHVVSDATWQRLARHFGEQELLELLFVIGSYVCLAMVLNSAGLQPDGGPDLGSSRT